MIDKAELAHWLTVALIFVGSVGALILGIWGLTGAPQFTDQIQLEVVRLGEITCVTDGSHFDCWE